MSIKGVKVEFVSSLSDYRLTRSQKLFAIALGPKVSQSLYYEKIYNIKFKRIHASPLNTLITSNFGPPIGAETQYLLETKSEKLR